MLHKQLPQRTVINVYQLLRHSIFYVATLQFAHRVMFPCLSRVRITFRARWQFRYY